MADVSSTFSALSSTESNSANGPSGATVIGSGLDENLRMGMAQLAAWRDQTGWGGVNLTSVAGTNTVTATVATAGSITFGPTALTAGMRFVFIPAATNTGASTLTITSPNGGSSLGAKNIFNAGAACTGGELVLNVPVEVVYDGTQFNIIGSFLGPLPLGQIKFPATQNPSSDVNTLDDYEEGTWTPTLTFATPGDLTVVYSVRTASYTKIGRQVNISCCVTTSTFTHSTASGNLQITGLPFTAATSANLNYAGTLVWQGLTITGFTQTTPRVDSNTALILFLISTSANSISSVGSGNVPTGGTVQLQLSLTYNV